MEATRRVKLQRGARALARTVRELGLVARTLLSRDRPLLAQIVAVRRCNLACSYCNEYDDFSAPVDTAEMFRRIDRLAELGTAIVTFSGGEPMLHPELPAQIRRIRAHGMVAGLITNGYFLQRERIEELNDAGLDHLQISIDNVQPDAVSKKSLKVLDAKLANLARWAHFHVNINSVLGAGTRRPEDVLTITRRALDLGFSTSIGVIHDGQGQLSALDEDDRAVYRRVGGLARGLYTRVRRFEENLVEGRENAWRCRAGARYLYVCEDGLVHYCSQQRGAPAVPLAEYDLQHIRSAFHAPKACAPRCTVGCVHRASSLDAWRAQAGAPATLPETPLVSIRLRPRRPAPAATPLPN
jgi:MoaA/NifB/PqqE/SkfB family radical SAM enzyme